MSLPWPRIRAIKELPNSRPTCIVSRTHWSGGLRVALNLMVEADHTDISRDILAALSEHLSRRMPIIGSSDHSCHLFSFFHKELNAATPVIESIVRKGRS